MLGRERAHVVTLYQGDVRQQDLSLLVLTSLARLRSCLSVFSTMKQPSPLPSPNCPFWKEVTTRSPQLRREQLHANPSRAEPLCKMLGILLYRFPCSPWREFKRARTQVKGCLSLPFGGSPAPQKGCSRSTPLPGCREERPARSVVRDGPGVLSFVR